jgi:uncharacterized protein YkwD
MQVNRQRAYSAGLAALSLFLAVVAAACVVPISAYDQTQTPAAPDAGGLLGPAALTREQASPETPVGGALATASTSTPTPPATGTGTATPGTSVTPVTTGTPAATATATPRGTPGPSPTTASQPVGDLAAEAVKVLNDYRVSVGKAPFKVNPNLSAAAASYAKLMADRSWFNCGCDPHDGPDGSSPQSRVAAAGYTGRWRGEALAGGQKSAQEAINTWLNSPSHAAIVLDTVGTEVGIGLYYKPGDIFGYYWVLSTGIQ